MAKKKSIQIEFWNKMVVVIWDTQLPENISNIQEFDLIYRVQLVNWNLARLGSKNMNFSPPYVFTLTLSQ